MDSFPYRTKTMRTDAEISEKIKSLENDPKDIFDFIRTDLICTLPYEQAKPFLNIEVNKEEWEARKLPRDQLGVLAEMKKYMNFAWDKANNCRGLSACRSLMHMQAWLWLLGEDEVSDTLTYKYSCYGKPELRAICEHYEWDWVSLDNGRWSDDEGGEGDPRPAATLPWRT